MNRDDLDTEIEEAIDEAIKDYQFRRWHFNELVTTFPTVVGQTDYAAAASAYLPDLYEIDSISSVYAGSVYELKQKPQLEIERLISSNSAQDNYPFYYTYYAQTLRLYPIPNDVYTIRIAGVLKVAGPASDAEEDNPWMNDGADLIRCAALADLHGGVMEDSMAMARYWEAKCTDAEAKLNAERSRRQSVTMIYPGTI